MEYFIDIAVDSINKYGEELCGDNVEVIKTDDGVVLVLADGLGSGVKANILATMTSKIAATMLKEGITIYETVDTIANTLPVCNVRKLAYSTFAIIKVDNSGKVEVFEYDNPPLFYINNGKAKEIEKKTVTINGKEIKQSTLFLEENDIISVVSDGVIHAGVGGVLNFGWQWENVCDFLLRQSKNEKCAKHISKNLVEACNCLYLDKPGDDTTVAVIKLREPEYIDLFTGPPEDKNNDSFVVNKLKSARGKKVVCGGTAANIVSRELDEELKINMDYIDPEVPPIANIKGIDLVTEGVLTLSKVIENIQTYIEDSLDKKTEYNISKTNGVSLLTKLLIDNCTHLNLWIGKAVNPAHQNPNFPKNLSIKLNVVMELKKMLENLGKIVNVTYV